jgi:hypothetical protein
MPKDPRSSFYGTAWVDANRTLVNSMATIDYDAYIVQCAPSVCSYTYHSRANLQSAFTQSIGLFGGFAGALQLLIPIFVDLFLPLLFITWCDRCMSNCGCLIPTSVADTGLDEEGKPIPIADSGLDEEGKPTGVAILALRERDPADISANVESSSSERTSLFFSSTPPSTPMLVASSFNVGTSELKARAAAQEIARLQARVRALEAESDAWKAELDSWHAQEADRFLHFLKKVGVVTDIAQLKPSSSKYAPPRSRSLAAKPKPRVSQVVAPKSPKASSVELSSVVLLGGTMNSAATTVEMQAIP